jgi:protein kinase-like protein
VQTTAFGRYRLLDLLGRGGMGQVFRAYDTGTQRQVALKLLPPELAGDAEFQQRFRREAHAVAGLNEPHVVPIHDFGEIDGRLYVDMRLIEGTDLDGLLEAEVLTPQRAVGLVEQVATALEAAHRAGLVHRDVKPSNILVGARDFAYLIDFGLARPVDGTRLTSAGQTMGTMAYMAPERFDTGAADERSDVYSLTCVLYQCLTGERPFSGDTLQQQIKGHLLTAPPRPSTVRPELGTAFDDVIAVGMAKEPAQRISSALELAAAARGAVDGIALGAATVAARIPPVTRFDPHPAADASGSAVTTVLAGRVRRRRRWRWIAGLVGVLLVAGGVVGGLGWRHAEQVKTAAATQRVRGVIERYDLAVQNGNLALLRGMTCGITHDRYQHDTIVGWGRAHTQALETGQYPIDAGISHVVVNGDSASADVVQYQSATPQVRTTRTFELRMLNGRWKVCSDGR